PTELAYVVMPDVDQIRIGEARYIVDGLIRLWMPPADDVPVRNQVVHPLVVHDEACSSAATRRATTHARKLKRYGGERVYGPHALEGWQVPRRVARGASDLGRPRRAGNLAAACGVEHPRGRLQRASHARKGATTRRRMCATSRPTP